MNILEKYCKEVVDVSWNFAKRCKTWDDEVMNCALGLSGEVGEMVDNIKKMMFHTPKPKEFFRDKIVLELGDVFYYATKLMDLFDITLEEVLDKNKIKIESRHPEHGKVTERYGAGAIK